MPQAGKKKAPGRKARERRQPGAESPNVCQCPSLTVLRKRAVPRDAPLQETLQPISLCGRGIVGPNMGHRKAERDRFAAEGPALYIVGVVSRRK